jgi:hypothetical protein
MEYELLSLGETMLALAPPAGEAIRDAAAPLCGSASGAAPP